MSRSGLRNDCPPALTMPTAQISLVRAIQAAGVRAGEWPAVLDQLRTNLNASVVMLGHHEFVTGKDTAWFEWPSDSHFCENMTAFAARNPWYLSSKDYTPGRVMTGDELISRADLQRTDFYRGFLQPRGLLHRLCGVVSLQPQGAFCVSLYRAESQGAFGLHEKNELQLLLAHITLSMESHWRWQEADDMTRALLSLFDHDTSAIILATADAEPIYRNAAAAHLLDGHVGLCLDGTHLVAASAADQRMLRETIARVAQDDATQAAQSLRVVTLACPPPAPPVVAMVRAAGRIMMRGASTRRGLVLITVRGGHATHDPSACVFARQYELTIAQAKVSALVFAGQPLPTIAHLLNVSENTVRSHLKQIYQKTDTHGQMDLVHLHARVCQTLA